MSTTEITPDQIEHIRNRFDSSNTGYVYRSPDGGSTVIQWRLWEDVQMLLDALGQVGEGDRKLVLKIRGLREEIENKVLERKKLDDKRKKLNDEILALEYEIKKLIGVRICEETANDSTENEA